MTIDMTPKWADLIPVLVHVAANGDSVEGRKLAMSELMRLATIVDNLNTDRKKPKEGAVG